MPTMSNAILNPSLPRRVILLAAANSYRMQAFADAAENLGIEVIQGSDVPPPLLNTAAAALPIDYRDIPKSAEIIVDYANDQRVDAILGLDDSGILLAAAASDILGLVHNAPEAARAAHSKYLMRRHFADAEVLSPGFRRYHLHDDPEEMLEEVSYPCVIKPTALAGSQGVMRADSPEELLACYYDLRPILLAQGCDELLVEDYIPGVEVALEGLLDEGELHILALFDKPDPLEGPFFEETIYVTPSRLFETDQQAIRSSAAAAAAALGLRSGPVHAELRLNEQGAWLVELAARSIGGLCAQTLRFGDDISLEELILRQALGLDLKVDDLSAQARGVMMIPIPTAGVLRAVSGIELAMTTPCIDEIEITAQLSYPVTPPPKGNSYLGFIFATGDTPDAVEAALRESHSKLHFEIEQEIVLRSGS